MDDAVELLDGCAEENADVALCSAAGRRSARARRLSRTRRACSTRMAKRALLVSADAWADADRADAIRRAMALGRVDHFVLEPGPPPDEVFHEAIASFLLEWAREQRRVPHTVHDRRRGVVGPGVRAAGTCSRTAPCRTRSASPTPSGDASCSRKAGPDARLPLMVLPDGTRAQRSVERRDRAAAGAPQGVDERTFDIDGRRRRAGGPVGRRLRRLRGA